MKRHQLTGQGPCCRPGSDSRYPLRIRLRIAFASVASLFLLTAAIACTTAGTPFDGSQFASIDGNWVFTMTTTSGTAPFSTLGGYINDESGGTVTGAFQADTSQGSSCYLGAETIPLEGTRTGSQVGLYSFSVNGQYLSMDGTENSSGTELTGTFKIMGGCAKDVSGTFTATHYKVLNGTYSGTFGGNSNYSAQITLDQNTLGTGSGTFFVSGSAVFQGISCFSSGTMSQTQGSIIGDTVALQFTTSPAGSTVTMSGSIDPLAKTLTVTSSSITGNCAEDLGAATFSLQ